MNTRKSERGQALILIVFAIVGLVGLTALTVDGGLAYSDRRNAQNAADNAAMAAARSKVRNGSWKNDALSMAGANGYVDTNAGSAASTTRANVEVYTCAEAGNSCPAPYAGDSAYLQVIITSTVPTNFAPVVGVRTVTNKVYSIAMASMGQLGPLYNGAAMAGLKQNVNCKANGMPDPNDTPAINFDGSMQIQTWGGGIYSNATATCGMSFKGSTQVQTHECNGCDSGLWTASSTYYTQGSPSIQTHGEGSHYNVEQQPYPPPNMPNPVCDTNATWSGTNMGPGNYTGTFPPAGVTNLQSGVYCIDGDFYMGANKSISGTGVVIVLKTGELDWQGNSRINLSAPTDGIYKGLLFYAPYTNTGTSTVQGNSDSTLRGTILMPGQDIVMTGSYQFQKTESQIIGYTVTMTGSSQVEIVADPQYQYVPPIPPVINLAK